MDGSSTISRTKALRCLLLGVAVAGTCAAWLANPPSADPAKPAPAVSPSGFEWVEADQISQLASGVVVSSRVMVSEALVPVIGGTGIVRTVAVCHEVSVGAVLLSVAYTLEAVSVDSSDPIEQSALEVNLGNAPIFASLVLGLKPPDQSMNKHDYAMAVAPVKGKVWGEVSGSGDMSITVTERAR